jgi:hypothetical protein
MADMENTNTQAVAEMTQAEVAAVLATYVAIPADDARYAALDAAFAAAPECANGRKASIFENKTCGRCGGSGNYSYCQRYGTTCFGCGGSGRKYTSRGLAAKRFADRLMSKPARDVKVGESVASVSVTTNGDVYSQWERVQAVGVGQGCTLHMVMGQLVGSFSFGVLTNKCRHGVSPETLFRVAADKTTKRAAMLAGLEYQSTLTAKGTPARRSRKAVAT